MEANSFTILNTVIGGVLLAAGWIGRQIWLGVSARKKSHRAGLRKLIAEARALLAKEVSVHDFERSDVYHQLRSHLSPEVRRFIDTRNARPDKDGVTRVIVYKRSMDWAHSVRDDLARLEKRKGLLPWAYTTDE